MLHDQHCFSPDRRGDRPTAAGDLPSGDDLAPFGPLAGVPLILIRRSERDDPDFTAEAAASPHDPPRMVLWAALGFGALWLAMIAAEVLS